MQQSPQSTQATQTTKATKALGVIHWPRAEFRQGYLAVVTSPVAIISLLVVAVLLSILGPFGSYASIAMPARLVYWLLLIGLNTISAVAVFWLCIGLKAVYEVWYDLLLPIVICSLLNAIPGAFIVTTVHEIFLTQAASTAGAEQLNLWHFNPLIGTGLSVSLITAMLFTGFMFVRIVLHANGEGTQDANQETDQNITKEIGNEANNQANNDASNEPQSGHSATHEQVDVAPAFYARIPETIQGELLALSSEDHYIRVYTVAGDALIHGALKEAMAELPITLGRQVHRSHWVASTAVQRAERRNNQWVLTLTNGVEIPVSRQQAPALKKAGWFN